MKPINKVAIENLADLLTYFSADSADRAKRDWINTGMKIQILNVLIKLRNQLEIQDNSKLEGKFISLKTDFRSYLLEKLNGQHPSDQDDLLWEINEIIELHLSEVYPEVEEDIKKLDDPLKTSLLEKDFEAARRIL